MIEYDTVFRARRLVTAAGVESGCVGVAGGRIAALSPLEAGLKAQRVVELGDDVVLLPGLVDSHVHVNEPGRTEWEGFATATRAAAAGGVTTILDMPLNSIPPAVDVAALQIKRKSAEGQCFVDVGFWGGAIPDNLSSRPRAAENLAITQVVQAARRTGARAHILHLSSSDALPTIAGARREGVRITVETCPHYLALTAEEVPRALPSSSAARRCARRPTGSCSASCRARGCAARSWPATSRADAC
jgi:dihydroorotase-like cyclic amidohydrolase